MPLGVRCEGINNVAHAELDRCAQPLHVLYPLQIGLKLLGRGSGQAQRLKHLVHAPRCGGREQLERQRHISRRIGLLAFLGQLYEVVSELLGPDLGHSGITPSPQTDPLELVADNPFKRGFLYFLFFSERVGVVAGVVVIDFALVGQGHVCHLLVPVEPVFGAGDIANAEIVGNAPLDFSEVPIPANGCRLIPHRPVEFLALVFLGGLG